MKHTIPADGATIAVEEVGTGPAMVFLHAFPLDRTMWAPQFEALAPTHRCIAPDMRGLGESRGDGPWTMERYADDVIAVLDALGVERAALVGLSMGGYVAFALWRRHRARISALALADTRAGADTEAGRARREELIALAESRGSAAVAAAQLPGLLGKTTHATRPELVERVRDMIRRAPVPGVVGALRAMLARPDSTPLLSTIKVPTLVVGGAEDTIAQPTELRAMADRIAGSRFVTIPGAGHLTNLETAGEFNAALSALGSRLSAGASPETSSS